MLALPLAAATVVGLVLGDAAVASAHAVLESSSPAPGSVVPKAPREVVLHFDEPVEIQFGSIRLFDSRGDRVDKGTDFHPRGDTSAVAVSSNGIGRGTFVAAWRVISDDGHPVGGTFVFSVGSPTVTHTKVTSPSDAELLARRLAAQGGSRLTGAVYWLVRTVVYASMLVVVGGMVVEAVMWRGAWQRVGTRRVLWGAWGALLAGTVAAVAVQGVYAAELPLTRILSTSLIDSVLHTRLGALSMVRVGLLLLVAFLLSSLESWQPDGSWRVAVPRWWAPVALATGAGLLLTAVLSGHAATGRWVAVGVPVDLAHLAAVSLWLGGLAVVAVLLIGPALLEPGERPDLVAFMLRFFRASFWAVAVVVASGLLQAVRQVGSLDAVWSTTYGRLLVAKGGLVCVILAAAGLSRHALHGRLALPVPTGGRAAVAHLARATGPGAALAGHLPPAAGASWRRRLRLLVAAELVIAASVLGVTSGLVNAEPAQEVEAQPYAKTLSVGGVQTTILVEPSAQGPANQFHIFTLHPDGLPYDVRDVGVSLFLPAERIGPLRVPVQTAGFAHYIAVGVDMPISGDWRMTVTVWRDSLHESQVRTTLTVH
jgi:copper transport protein